MNAKKFFGLLVLLSASSAVRGQLPVTLSGTLRLANLTRLDAGPFVPDGAAPPGFVAAYGHVGGALPASYPTLPKGYNDLGGFTGRITGSGIAAFDFRLDTIFYVLTDTGLVPGVAPQTLRRELSGTWALFDGQHTAPTGTLRGSFDLQIVTFPGPNEQAGTMTGSLTVLSATGTLGFGGLLGARHDLVAETNTFPNWLNTGPTGTPTGGDLGFLTISPTDRMAAVDSFPLAPGVTDGTAVDLNGDGALDLAFVDEAAHTVRFLINDGVGAFTSGGQLPIAGVPVRVRAGLLNPDAREDLVVARREPAGVDVYRALPGGGFLLTESHALAEAPTDLDIADATFDGRPEFVVAMPGFGLGTGAVRVFVNDGLGNFPLSANLTGSWIRPVAVDFAPQPLAARPDLFVADAGPLGSTGQAVVHVVDNPLFAPATVGLLPVGDEPRAIKSVDLNLDRNPDLVVGSFGNPIVGAYGDVRVFAATGLATFAPGITVASGVTVTALDVFDQDRDSRPELVFTTWDQASVTVLPRWNGLGFDAPLVVPLSSPGFAAFGADLDANGFPDLVASAATAGEASVALSIPRAQSEAIGVGCAGSFGNVPIIATGRLPNLENITFTIQVRNALANTQALLFLSLRPQMTLLPGSPPGCAIQLSADPGDLIPGTGEGQFFQITDTGGFAQVFLPIPPAPFLNGLNVWAQWVIVDPGASVPTNPTVALSGGLRVTLY